MKRGVALLLVALAALALGAGGAMAAGWWTPWAQRYVQGVDVSHHQGPIDWRALAGDDVAFAYIKASEGGDHVDPRFAENWAQSRGHVLRGAYHFFTLCRPGAVQAAHFIATAPREAGALPPAVDLEHMGPCRQGPTSENVIGEIDAYLDAVEAAYGVRPILYTTREFHDAHLAELRGETFWIRSLFNAPDFRARDWVIWQHHNRGQKRGVSGPIDLNAFRGDRDDLAAFAASTEEPST